MNRIKQHIASASPLFWVLLVIVVLGLSMGGVSAYLTWSSAPVENQFTVAEHPTVTVDSNYRVTVQDPGYAVYLRAHVVVNWERTTADSTYTLADSPKEGTDYTLGIEDNWKRGADGFFYYKNPIQDFTQTTPVVTVTQVTTKEGYTLNVTVLAQTIQAVGSTDPVDSTTPTIDAVQDAWPTVPSS